MKVRRRYVGPRRSVKGTWPVLVLVLVSLLTVAAGCAAFSDPDENKALTDVERESRQEGDNEGEIGEELEIYTLTATLLSVERVASYGELDNRGYIEAKIRMDNPSSKSVQYKRSDWRLEKPDGSLSNTATVSSVIQIQDDTVAAGSSVEGTVIYSAGELSGQFAIVFNPQSLTPSDPLQAERAVWVFDSSPQDAE